MLKYMLIAGTLIAGTLIVGSLVASAQGQPVETGEIQLQQDPEMALPSEQPFYEVYEPVPAEGKARIVRVGKTLSLSEEESIGSAIVIVGDVLLNGTVYQDLMVIQGSVRLGPQALVEGDLILLMAEAEFQAKQVKGEVRQIQSGPIMSGMLSLLMGPPRRESDPGSLLIHTLTGYRVSWGNIWLFWKITVFLLILLVHIFLVSIFSTSIEYMADGMISRPLGGVLIGLGVALILVPVAGLSLFSLLGLPIMLAMSMILVILAIYGKTAIILAIGNAILQQERASILAVLLGYFIYSLTTSLPYVGLPMFLLVNFLSMGLCLRTQFGMHPVDSRKQRRQSNYEVRSGWDSPVRGS